ncbi:MAG: DUF5305 family protein [Dehalogenimonas sp.]|uniref:DUF5305 family protein n=1 Tax=Candidatus Dehalogenimonas loeffleri TaxID=3127115 RepID=A0ABZ2J9X7_9CHLR|nr:DUF5305 family protein [Dehalogenimonas sp.]
MKLINTLWKALTKLPGGTFHRVVSVIFCALFIIAAAGFGAANIIPLQHDVTVDLLTYQHQGEYDYTAYLKPSYLLGPDPVVYEEPEPPPNPTYFTNIINDISFTYSFTTDTNTILPNVIKVTAILENADLWQKEIPLHESDLGIQGRNKMDIEFTLGFQAIQETFNTIDKELKITTNDRKVTLMVTILAGDQEFFTQTLEIIINKSYVEISNERLKTDSLNLGLFDYAVNLMPNTLFEATALFPPALYVPPPPPPAPVVTTIGPEGVLFTKLVDRMDFTFAYTLDSDKPLSNVTSSVRIFATIENPQFWTKKVELIPLMTRTGDFTVSFTLKPEDYLQLLEDIRGETGTSAETYYFTVVSEVNISADSEYGPINESFTATLKTAVSGGVLNWGETLINTQDGTIQTTEVQDSYFIAEWTSLLVADARILFLWLSIISLVLAAPLVFFYFKHRPPGLPEADKEARQAKRRFKGMLTEVSSLPAIRESDVIVSIQCLEDLVNIANEMGKTVLYHQDHRCHSYQVLDDFTRYEYQTLC